MAVEAFSQAELRRRRWPKCKVAAEVISAPGSSLRVQVFQQQEVSAAHGAVKQRGIPPDTRAAARVIFAQDHQTATAGSQSEGPVDVHGQLGVHGRLLGKGQEAEEVARAVEPRRAVFRALQPPTVTQQCGHRGQRDHAFRGRRQSGGRRGTPRGPGYAPVSDTVGGRDTEQGFGLFRRCHVDLNVLHQLYVCVAWPPLCAELQNALMMILEIFS